MKGITSFAIVILFLVACEKDDQPPVVTAPVMEATSAVTAITYTSAKVSGKIISSGNAVILSRGVCSSATVMPTISNSKVDSAGGIGSFICDLTGLEASTTYYARSFVTTAFGTVYGNQVSFTTLLLPVVNTTSVSSITATSAVCAGSITNGGSSTVTARGICWSTSMNPTTSLSTKIFIGSGTGSFSSNITGLTTATTYYVRAFATNSGGTSYGSNYSFRTL